MNAKALVVVLVALLGAAGFWILSGSGDAAPAPHPQGASAADGAPGKATAEPAQAALAPAAAGSSAAAALPAVERTEAPVPVGTAGESVTLRGRLVDGKGAPRAGVVLSVRTWVPAEDIDLGDLPPPPMPGTRDRDGAERPNWTTRADGTFQIPLARNRAGSLELVTDRLVFAGSEPSVDGRKGDKDFGDLVVLQEASLAGFVRDERGQPVAGVKIAATIGAMGFGSTSSSTSKADGSFTLGMLRPARWTLRTASGKFLPTVQEVEVAAEERKTDVVLVVKPGNAIAGQVVDDRGVGVAGMKVGSKRKEARGGVDIERFSPDEATTTDANGYFTLSGLAEETASVRAFGPGHCPAIAADVPVGTGNLVLRVERAGIVEGVLVSLDGTAIAGSRVRASTADGAAGGGEPGGLLDAAEDFVLSGPPGEGRATTGADGSFRIEGIKPGNVLVTATGAAHRPARSGALAVLPAQVIKGVRLVADLGAMARVTVKDEAGKPVAGATVSAMRPDAESGPGGNVRVARRVAVEDAGGEAMVFNGDEPLGKATTDAQGVAMIAGLPAGDVVLRAKHADYAPAPGQPLTLPKSGVTEAALTMRQPGRAEILVLGSDGAPQAGVEVRVQPGAGADGAEAKTVSTGDGGKASITGLVPGEYTAALARKREPQRLGDAMMFIGDGGETIASSARTFVVAAGQLASVELRRPVLARVHGVVSGTDGPAAGCIVQLLRQDGETPEIPGFGGRNTTTGADGAYAFDEVEAGRYLLEFGKREQLVKAQQECEVPANGGDVRQDLALRTGKVRVQAVAQGSGDPVAKAEVELVRAAAPVSSGAPRPQRRVMMVSMVMTNDGAEGGETTSMTVGNQRAFTDEDGVAEIDDVPVGEWTVRIKHRKHAPFELAGKSVVERQLTDCGRVELGAAGVIRGKVTTADGKVARMALVSTRPADKDEWSEPVMAQGGNYRVQGLAAGKYKVRAQAIGDGGQFSPEVDVEVKAGETAPLDLKLPPQ